MKKMMVAAFALAIAGAQAQDNIAVGQGRGMMIQPFQQAGTFTARPDGVFLKTAAAAANQTVTGRPVSGTEEHKSRQTLGDGTVISTSTSDRFYRDSAGRTRTENAEGRIVISDPVAHTIVTLNPATKMARQNPLPPGGDRINVAITLDNGATRMITSTLSPAIDVASAAEMKANAEKAATMRAKVMAESGARMVKDDENVKHEDLGVESLNGVLATHTRDTVTIPQGQIGNDRDIHVVNERWYSDDLQMLVKTVNSDPRFGDNTYELTNVSRDEPDAALFQIPAGYTIASPEWKRDTVK